MRTIIFCSLFFATSSLWAKVIKVHYNNFHSTINIKDSNISYKDVNTSLSIDYQNCNVHILKQLNQDILKHSVISEKKSNYPITLTIDNKKITIDQRSEIGQFYYNFIEKMKLAKIEEIFNCENKQ